MGLCENSITYMGYLNLTVGSSKSFGLIGCYYHNVVCNSQTWTIDRKAVKFGIRGK